jgi:hypothetical protein
MRRRFIMIWFLVLFLFSSLLVWRLTVIQIPLVGTTVQRATVMTPKTPSPTTHVGSESTQSPITHLRQGFMSGVIFPQWGKQAYSSYNSGWNIGLQEIAQQTNAHWLSLPITFHQKNKSATEVEVRNDIPSPQTLASAIAQAHQYGFQVFIYPLLSVDGENSWAGQIDFTSQVDAITWFRSYWQALRPYVAAASEARADQFSIGNEFELLEGHFDDLWRTLIEQVHGIYNGSMVYSINWSSLKYRLPGWLRYSGLNAIGVSTYIPLADAPQHLDFPALPKLWHQRVGDQLDAFAQALKKPVFISEIGYRNTQDAGYLPYKSDPGTNAPRDDAEQAHLYEAALQNIVNDRLINGIFIWAWGIALYSPNDKPAAQVLKKWFGIL